MDNLPHLMITSVLEEYSRGERGEMGLIRQELPGREMNADEVRKLIEDLRSDDENLRLKAANRFTRDNTGAAKEAIPVLKEIFWKDANPAVKFLARKALENLGENVSEVAAKEAQDIVPKHQRTGQFRLLPDGDILWKCAQEEIKPCIPLLLPLINSKDNSVLEQVGDALEKLGTVLSAAPLVEAFMKEQESDEWRREVEESIEGAEVVRELLNIAKIRHSGINPATAAAMGNLNCPEVKEAFIDMLRSSNPILRRNAVKTLAELNDPATITPMMAMLERTEDPKLMSRVMKTISKLAAANPSAQAEVLKILLKHFKKDAPERVLAAVVEAVGRIAHPGTVGFLKKCLRHPCARVRANAVEALTAIEISERELVEALTPLLEDENNRVVGNAVVALWNTSARTRALQVATAEVSHSDKWHRASIAYALGEIDTEESVELLFKLLKDDDEDVRRNAVEAVRKLTNPDAVARLVEFVNDDDDRVKLYAIEQIGKARLESYNDILLLVLETTENPEIIASTLLALGRMKLEENIPTISYYLNDTDPRVRANAIEALVEINDAKVTTLIQMNLNDANSRVQANAIIGLWRFGELHTAGRLQAMLRHPSDDFKASGAYALGEVSGSVRLEQNLIRYPLLVAALRQHPKYTYFKEILRGL